jgi:hypothetical protein
LRCRLRVCCRPLRAEGRGEQSNLLPFCPSALSVKKSRAVQRGHRDATVASAIGAAVWQPLVRGQRDVERGGLAPARCVQGVEHGYHFREGKIIGHV